ncbi:MAG: Cof-type HAD-IIB family hydrolase [Candidatus Izemoplasmatales bacterium]
MAIVFMDLDGTLLENGHPAKNSIEAIKMLKANGHLPVVATGRVPYLAEDILQELQIDTYICASGSYIVSRGMLLVEKKIEIPLIERLFEFADLHKIDIVSEATNHYVAYRKETNQADLFADYFQVKRPTVDKDYHYHHPILAFNVFDHHIIDELRKEFPEFVINKASDLGYDINIKGDLKADGMSYLVDYLKYPENEVYAIGDAYNDISMIQKAHTGIAMGNAKEEVKKVSDYVTTDVSVGGVYDALKHFGLI